ncbi:MAG TPA: efflux RND transporter periplasmic adaptor subunit [Candidatus Binatia bacterium]|nr:efflux RND transporter periplasmic adaptor subunit [Candidatus Binatia bacterium]
MTNRRTRWTAAFLLALAVPAGAADDGAADRAPIRLDPAQRQAIGLTLGTAERRASERIVRTTARLDVDERKLAEVTLKVGGWIETLYADYTGRAVRRGEPLLSIYSPDLVTAEEEYLLALETARRLTASRVPEARASADALVRASRERLRLWDLGDVEVAALARRGRAGTTAVIRSPIAGVVIEKAAVRGQRVEPGTTLFKVADLSTVWVYADVYEQDLPFVRVGQEGVLTLPSMPGQRFTARITWVPPLLDPKTRSAPVRLELPNTPDAVLRPETYGTLELRVPLPERLVVPDTAVLDSGRRRLVFVDAGDGRLVPRTVEVGTVADGWAEIRSGLEPGERVVTSANFLVDSESRLAAAESMMGMMGALGMGGGQMGGARMEMGGGGAPPRPEEREVDGLRVAVFPAREPATVGDVPLRVRVRDASGAPVTGATLRLEYTMDMPGMQIEAAPTRELGDGVYEGMVRFTMGGPWSVVVEVARPGTPPVRGRFTVRVTS